MKLAVALILLVLAAGCTTTYQQPLPEKEPVQQATQQAAQQAATPQPTVTPPLNVKISFAAVPSKASQNSKVVIKWKVDSNQEKTISHTAVHYGGKSVPGSLSTDVTPANAGYTDLTGISTPAKIPSEFSLPIFTKVKGTIYLRAHVIVGDKNYWTEERSIAVE